VSKEINQTVVVFGAGEAGRRALACLRREPGWDVLGFADNAQRRHGTAFEGLPVLPPASLAVNRVDRIVVASADAPEIVPQLHALGIATACIDLYHVEDDEIHPTYPEAAAWPRILVLSDECISACDDAGAAPLRHFAGYPRRRLLHAYLRSGADSTVSQCDIRRSRQRMVDRIGALTNFNFTDPHTPAA